MFSQFTMLFLCFKNNSAVYNNYFTILYSIAVYNNFNKTSLLATATALRKTTTTSQYLKTTLQNKALTTLLDVTCFDHITARHSNYLRRFNNNTTGYNCYFTNFNKNLVRWNYHFTSFNKST